MTSITLPNPWTYRTPEMTVNYPAGAHDMPDDIAAAAKAAGVTEEKKDGGRAAKAGAAGAAGDAEG